MGFTACLRVAIQSGSDPTEVPFRQRPWSGLCGSYAQHDCRPRSSPRRTRIARTSCSRGSSRRPQRPTRHRRRSAGKPLSTWPLGSRQPQPRLASQVQLFRSMPAPHLRGCTNTHQEDRVACFQQCLQRHALRNIAILKDAAHPDPEPKGCHPLDVSLLCHPCTR